MKCRHAASHIRESSDPKGKYVRVRLDNKWYWAVETGRTIKLGGKAYKTYIQVDKEGEKPGVRDTDGMIIDTTNMLIGVDKVKPAAVCIVYGELEVE